jgi:sensor histidine kinase YesM
MRFGNKVAFKFEIDETIDLKDFKVPALILQPFIENAIWHGLMAKENGGKVDISVNRSNGAIQCVIEDNGIGREASKMFKPHYESTYQSRAIGLTQSRLELDKLLNEREDAIFIVDKEDEYGRPEGTKVILTFKEN